MAPGTGAGCTMDSMWFLDGMDTKALAVRLGSWEQVAGIDRLSEEDGPARGSRRFRMRTGSGLVVDVLPDRALDLGPAEFRGVPLAWVSPAGHVAPGLAEQRGTQWQRSFGGGMLSTCGLDQFGAPNHDDDTELPLHGRVGTIPAEQVNTRRFHDGEQVRLEVEGEVRQSRLFGENLLLHRRIESTLGSTTIRLRDTVTNDGARSQPHMLLYHMNFGWPLLSERATLSVPGTTAIPRGEEAARAVGSWSTFTEPAAHFPEQVFRHAVHPAGPAEIVLANPDLGLECAVRFDSRELPGLFQWKLLEHGSYVLGVEPANCSVITGRADARAQGMLPHLTPGESRSYTLEVEVRERTVGDLG